MDVPVVFWWQDTMGERQHAEGHTYDVSELGAFVLASLCPPAGAHVNVEISIAAVPETPLSQGMRVEIEGQVLRVERIGMGQGRDGFAILTEQAIFDEAAESSSRTRLKLD